MPGGGPWPRITVVTPSLNQGQFLEETIRSVLGQGYPNLEYFVVDGGSSDDSVEIIRRHEQWISWWVSEPDHGQVDAILKGLSRATGDIANWINSDDFLPPGTLHAVAAGFSPGVDAVAASCITLYPDGNQQVCANRRLDAVSLIRGTRGSVFQQPAFWFHPERLARCGGLDRRLHYVFDMEMAVRYLARFPRVRYLTQPLAYFRLHPESKSVAASRRFWDEWQVALQHLLANDAFPGLHRHCGRRIAELERHRHVASVLRDDASSRLSRLLHLSLQAMRGPRPGLAAINLAAARRLLTGRRWFLDEDQVCEPPTLGTS